MSALRLRFDILPLTALSACPNLFSLIPIPTTHVAAFSYLGTTVCNKSGWFCFFENWSGLRAPQNIHRYVILSLSLCITTWTIQTVFAIPLFTSTLQCRATVMAKEVRLWVSSATMLSAKTARLELRFASVVAPAGWKTNVFFVKKLV